MARKKKQRVTNNLVANNLQSALGLGFQTPFGTYGTQLSQSETLFKNLRWYLISNFRQLLSQLYAEIGMVQTIIDIPVDDALRGGIEIKTAQLNADQIMQLNSKMERQGDLRVAGQSAKWNRLYGGAGILTITDQDAEKQLNIKAINNKTPIRFHAIDMWEMYFDLQNIDDTEVQIDTRLEDSIVRKKFNEDLKKYNYYGQKVHQSRIMRLIGLQAPSFIRPRLRGWGLSVLESLVRPLNQFLKATDLSFEVLDEFKIDVYKFKDLAATLIQKGGEDVVHKRVQLSNMEKNYQHAITMDSEDDYAQKQLSFAGLADVQREIRNQLASELRIPQTKLFGQSAAGFSSGEDDIENYNAMIESTIREQLKFPILTMVELRCQQEFGFIPSDLTINFKSLRMMTSEQEQNVKDKIFARTLAALQAGQISSKTFADAVNQDELLPIHIQDEGNEFTISDEEPEGAVEGDEEKNQTDQTDSRNKK